MDDETRSALRQHPYSSSQSSLGSLRDLQRDPHLLFDEHTQGHCEPVAYRTRTKPSTTDVDKPDIFTFDDGTNHAVMQNPDSKPIDFWQKEGRLVDLTNASQRTLSKPSDELIKEPESAKKRFWKLTRKRSTSSGTEPSPGDPNTLMAGSAEGLKAQRTVLKKPQVPKGSIEASDKGLARRPRRRPTHLPFTSNMKTSSNYTFIDGPGSGTGSRYESKMSTSSIPCSDFEPLTPLPVLHSTTVALPEAIYFTADLMGWCLDSGNMEIDSWTTSPYHGVPCSVHGSLVSLLGLCDEDDEDEFYGAGAQSVGKLRRHGSEYCEGVDLVIPRRKIL